MDSCQTPQEMYAELKEFFNNMKSGSSEFGSIKLRVESLGYGSGTPTEVIVYAAVQLRLELFKALTYISGRGQLVEDYDYWAKKLGLD